MGVVVVGNGVGGGGGGGGRDWGGGGGKTIQFKSFRIIFCRPPLSLLQLLLII